MPQVTRRDFLKISAAGSGAAGLTALGFDLAQASQIQQSFRIQGATESHSLCPYCAVGCSLVAFTGDDGKGGRKLLQIEGNPDSPVNEGRLCPKGATAMQLATSARRVDNPMYRAPGSDHWQQISWDDMPQRVKEARDATFVAKDASGNTVNRTEGLAFAGGAAFSSEEGYFATKVMRGLGLVHLEQQARV
ncbi:MAG: twin-arginine translocation signal domain-containing protein [Chloroflexi bacterium]|nr:MAG: twin-arginine translocation signal domain-containing protein [Chloroflexota bacterium]